MTTGAGIARALHGSGRVLRRAAARVGLPVVAMAPRSTSHDQLVADPAARILRAAAAPIPWDAVSWPDPAPDGGPSARRPGALAVDPPRPRRPSPAPTRPSGRSVERDATSPSTRAGRQLTATGPSTPSPGSTSAAHEAAQQPEAGAPSGTSWRNATSPPARRPGTDSTPPPNPGSDRDASHRATAQTDAWSPNPPGALGDLVRRWNDATSAPTAPTLSTDPSDPSDPSDPTDPDRLDRPRANVAEQVRLSPETGGSPVASAGAPAPRRSPEDVAGIPARRRPHEVVPTGSPAGGGAGASAMAPSDLVGHEDLLVVVSAALDEILRRDAESRGLGWGAW